ncbi:hypothetical protein [Rhodoplanes azumiensis]|uniref:Transcription factor zinc-finger domain-containing protein n=1 Tax=Rhodoplanes azumiensis TaxID=1897628 RepID=A0ABW5AET3_9BRAD
MALLTLRSCFPPIEETTVSVTHPLPIIRENDRQRLHRTAPSMRRALSHEPRVAQDRCPECAARAPVAPCRSNYVSGGVIEHHWACSGCGRAWVTRIDVSRLGAARIAPALIDTASQ